MMTVSFKSIASWSILWLMVIQFVPLQRINPPADSEIQLPDTIKSFLKQACYDCHSNETRWTSIAYVAPVSWLTVSTVASGRTALNFSTWNNTNNTKIKRSRSKIRSVILEGTAHQRLYYFMEPGAKLTESQSRELLQWLKATFEKQESTGFKN